MSVPLHKPQYPEHPRALLNTLRELTQSQRWQYGQYGEAFEQNLAQACGALYAVAVNSRKSALSLILRELKIDQRCEIICSPYISTGLVLAILELGATPVFADISPDSYSVDINDIIRLLNPAVRAILLTHPFGIPSDAPALAKFATDHGLFLLESVESGPGSKIDGKEIGTFGLAGLVDCHPNRCLALTESGMVLTDDDTLANRLKHANALTSDTNFIPFARMSEFHGVIGLWAVQNSHTSFEQRCKSAQVYSQALSEFPSIAMVYESGDMRWNKECFPIRLPYDQRARVAQAFSRADIETSFGPQPAHLNSYLEVCLRPHRLPYAEQAYEQTLVLPNYADLETIDQLRIIDTLAQALAD